MKLELSNHSIYLYSCFLKKRGGGGWGEESAVSEKKQKKRLNIHLLSDGTGETALAVLKAALIQYEHEGQARIFRHRNIRSREQMERLFEKISPKAPPSPEAGPSEASRLAAGPPAGPAAEEKSLLVYTLIEAKSRRALKSLCRERQVEAVDLLGSLIGVLDRSLKSKKKRAGTLRKVNEGYFQRIEAMDFFLKHDDGQMIEDLDEADIVLVGVSRTSKTPLSLFLSNKGWKVANIPLVYNIPPPEKLFQLNQKKIVALTINPDYLLKIRKIRLEKFGCDSSGDYADRERVCREVAEIQSLFQKRRWPVLNVTERALEETAGEIIRIVSARMRLPIKII